jgi:holin-like protein
MEGAVLGWLTLILACQLAGEAVASVGRLPVPGPVIGMAVLFCGLLLRRGMPEGLEASGGFLLRILPLLFVPAGVGIVTHLDVLARSWAAFAGAVVAGTAATIAAAGLVMQFASRRGAKGREAGRE